MRLLFLGCAALVALVVAPSVAVAGAQQAELQNEISSAAPFTTDGAKVFDVVVSAVSGGGPITAPVTTTVVAGDEGTTTQEWISSAGGDGWQCRTPGGGGVALRATCTRTDRLASGRGYPPIKVGVEVNESAPQYAYLTAATDTTSARDPRCADASLVIDFNNGPTPGRAMGRTPPRGPGDPVLNASLAYGAEGMVDVTVANRGAAATRGKVEVFIAFEPGFPSAAYLVPEASEGWTCPQGEGLAYGQITCTRQDVLWPGQSYPPIRVTPSAYTDLVLYAKATTAGGCEGQCSSGELRVIPT